MSDSSSTGYENMLNTITDTICALATPAGGAIAVLRLSGPKAVEIVDGVFSRQLAEARPNTLHYGEIKNDGGEAVDDVVVAVYRAPHSYTGEDSVEISCHGSRYIVQQLLMLLQAHGARPAEPGEYTRRAYLNGKMDLSQAEAVADLIASTNRAQHHMAISQLKGHFSHALGELREQLLKLTSLLELELDFSDHEDLEFADRDELKSLTAEIDTRIMKLAKSFRTGNALKEGIPVAIVGKTNVGKSTLLNALLHEDRAIVSDIHGTTRDTIEDTTTLNGVLFRFIDTAGLRQTSDEIERIGIDRALAAIGHATVVLWVIDGQPTAQEADSMMRRCRGKHLLILRNKSDLPHSDWATDLWKCPDGESTVMLDISAKTGQGVPQLEKAIYDCLDLPELSSADVVVTNARHQAALLKAHDDLSHVAAGLAVDLSPDLLAEDLRLVLDDLASITGQQRITPQETLNNIFSHFCIGK